jgi:diamine N-acetyltransferase
MKWENEPSLWVYSDTVAPLSRRIIAQYISNYDTDVFRSGQLRLMIDDRKNGNTVGIIDLFKVDAINANATVGIFIDPAHQRKGYAFNAIEIIAHYSHATLGLHQLLAWVGEDNHASLKLFEKCKFKEVGYIPDYRRSVQGFSGVKIMQRIL